MKTVHIWLLTIHSLDVVGYFSSDSSFFFLIAHDVIQKNQKYEVLAEILFYEIVDKMIL